VGRGGSSSSSGESFRRFREAWESRESELVESGEWGEEDSESAPDESDVSSKRCLIVEVLALTFCAAIICWLFVVVQVDYFSDLFSFSSAARQTPTFFFF